MKREGKKAVSWTRRLADLVRHQQNLAASRRIHPKRPVPRDSKILEQIKFYFSDANLRRDKYMHDVFQKDPSGWLTFGQLRTFPILRRMRVTDSEIFAACKRSDFFVTDQTYQRVKRNFHLYPNKEIELQLFQKSVPPQDELGAIEKRSLYVEKLPSELKLDDLKEKLHLQFPDVQLKYVSIPRHPVTGEGFGCAFIEFGSEENAKLILRKWKSIDSEKFDAVNGRMGRSVRVMTMGKYKALKRVYKAAKSLSAINRLGYAEEYNIDAGNHGNDETLETRESEHSSDTDSASSSLMLDSDMNSLAQDSVDARRSRNPSSIRSNSVVAISELPPTTAVNIRVWLSHSCAVQFLDYKDGDAVAHARFTSRRERDFFLTDFDLSKIPLLGTFPKIRALTETECTQYFESERERRRSLIHKIGHPDSWTPPPKRAKTSASEEISNVDTRFHVNRDFISLKSKNGIAYTDSVAGNANQGEPGTSILYGIRENRNVARKFLLDSLRDMNEEISPTEFSREKISSEKIDEAPPKPFRKTRRGRRGGKRYNRA